MPQIRSTCEDEQQTVRQKRECKGRGRQSRLFRLGCDERAPNTHLGAPRRPVPAPLTVSVNLLVVVSVGTLLLAFGPALEPSAGREDKEVSSYLRDVGLSRDAPETRLRVVAVRLLMRLTKEAEAVGIPMAGREGSVSHRGRRRVKDIARRLTRQGSAPRRCHQASSTPNRDPSPC